MKTIITLSDLKKWLLRNQNPAFVPTMGALHKGHLSLVRAAKKTDKPVLASVFVNPAQFAPNEDFEKYPRDKEGDSKKLESAGADAVWFPAESDIYPQGKKPRIPKLPKIFSQLEGGIRPTFFPGIAQVISRLFAIIHPSIAFFGQKDYQQTVLIRWLVKALKIPTEIVVCPIIREKNGLAMSSRNEYLSVEEKEAAAVLCRSLLLAKEEFNSRNQKNIEKIISLIHNTLQQEKRVTSIDYIEIRDAETLEKISKITKSAVILLVARIGGVRLLDNLTESL